MNTKVIKAIQLEMTKTEVDALDKAKEILAGIDKIMYTSGTNSILNSEGETICTEKDIRNANIAIGALTNFCVMVGK